VAMWPAVWKNDVATKKKRRAWCRTASARTTVGFAKHATDIMWSCSAAVSCSAPAALMPVSVLAGVALCGGFLGWGRS